MPISFQRYKNTSRYDTDCSPLVELPPGESPQIYRFFPFIFSINQSFICRRNYLFRYPHEHMMSFQYLATPKYVSFFSTFFQTQDIKTFWAWNLESLISRTGSFVTLDRIRCCSVLERQHALGTRMVSWKYLVCFICHSLETKASFFIFYVYVFLLL